MNHSFESRAMLLLVGICLVMLHTSLFASKASAQEMAPSSSQAPVADGDGSDSEPAALMPQPGSAASQLTAPGASRAQDARQQDLRAELSRLEQRSREAEKLRGRMAARSPVSLIMAGSALGAIYTVGAVSAGIILSDIKQDVDQSYDESSGNWHDEPASNQEDLKLARRLTGAMTAVAVLNVGLVAFGTWWLTKRLSARQRLDRELGRLEVEQRVLQMKLDVSADANGAVGQLVGRF